MNLNLLLIGKSGAGKSSFANYLFNEEVFKSGKGKPVTGWENNLESHHFSHEKYMLNVFDTVGMEADNISKWQSEIDTFVESKHDKNDVIENQLHGVFYIVNAASSRIEPYEEEIIKKFSKKHNLPVTVVFTNSDNADKNQLLEMKKILSSFSPIEVCSIAVKKRGGHSKQYGRDEVIDNFIKQFNSIFTRRALKSSIYRMNDTFMNLRHEMHKGIDKSELSVFNLSKIDDLDFDELCDTDAIHSSFEELSPILDFLDDLGVIDGHEVQDKIDSSLDSAFENFESKMQASFDKIEERMDNGEYFGVLKDIASLAIKVVRIKTTMKEIVDEIIHDANNQIRKDINNILDESFCLNECTSTDTDHILSTNLAKIYISNSFF